MAEKILNTRIGLKIDTFENWEKSTLVLKDGEVAFATVAASQGSGLTEPVIMMKIGENGKKFNELPWNFYAKASDVAAWAKADKKPSYAANEITGIDAYIAEYVNDQMGISVDTDTQYQIVKVDDYKYKLQSKGKADSAWADVADSEIVIPKYDDGGVKADINKINDKLKDIEEKAEVNIIETVKVNGTALTPDADRAVNVIVPTGALASKDKVAKADLDTALTNELNAKAAQADLEALSNKIGTVGEETVADMIDALAGEDGRVTVVEGKVAKLIGDDTNKSVRTIANEELAAQLIPENAKEALDTLGEIAAWIQSHPNDAGAMNAQITTLEGILDGIGGEGDTSATVVAYVTAAISALKIGDYAKVADLGDLAGKDEVTEADLAAALAKKLNDKAEAADLNGAVDRIIELEKVDHEHANKALLDTYTQTEANLKDAVAKKHAHTNADVLNGITADLVTKWNNKVEQADLIKEQDRIKAIEDRFGLDGDVLVFNCGTSAN